MRAMSKHHDRSHWPPTNVNLPFFHSYCIVCRVDTCFTFINTVRCSLLTAAWTSIPTHPFHTLISTTVLHILFLTWYSPLYLQCTMVDCGYDFLTIKELNANTNETRAEHPWPNKTQLYFGLASLPNRLLVKRNISLNGAWRISTIPLNRDGGCLSLCFRLKTPFPSSFSLFLLLDETFVTLMASSIWPPSWFTSASPLLLFRWPTPNAAQILRMCPNLVPGQFSKR